MYYAYIENEKINGIGQYPCKTTKTVEITKEIFDNIQNYIWNGSEVILDPELDKKRLREAKEAKIAQNDIARDNALIQGVNYKDVLFDSDTDQKVNLLAIVSTMDDEQTIVWFGKDNQPLLCNKQDLINIGGLITQLHSFCWNKNAEYKAAIGAAQNMEDLNLIIISYELPTEIEESEEE